MGERREKEVVGRSSGKAERSGESALTYSVFTGAPPEGHRQLQSDMRLNQLSGQLAQKTNELERLRGYVTKLEEGENGLIQELTRQLAIKDEEVSRIAALYTKKEAENKKLSTAFEAHIISEKENAERIKVLLLRKEQDTTGQTKRLQQEIERKDAEITSLRNALIQSRSQSKTDPRWSQTSGMPAPSGLGSVFSDHCFPQTLTTSRRLVENNILSRSEQPENSITHLKQAEEHLQKRLESKETELNSLQRTLLEERKLSLAAQSKLKEQLSQMEGQIEELKTLLIGKQEVIQQLQAEFEKSRYSAATTATAEKPGSKSDSDALKAELDQKNAEIAQLQKNSAAEQKLNSSIQSRLNEQVSQMSQQAEELKILLTDKQKLIQDLQAEFEKNNHTATIPANNHKLAGKIHFEALTEELERKNKEIARLERHILEEQKLNSSIQSRLKEQISGMARQMEELKSFIVEKEKLVQNLETAFERRIAAKEEEIRHLKTAIEHKPSTALHREIDRLKSEIQIKEEASAMMAEEMAKIKEQSALIRKRLEERQKIFFESERAYEELIGKLREQHDARVKALIHEASQKEATLSATLEGERAKIRKESALMKEKEKQIAETLQAFTTTSEQLIKLGSQAAAEGPGADRLAALQYELEEKQKKLEEQAKETEEREKYVHGKETELKKLLHTTEEKITLLNRKEAETGRKERLIIQEQEAINRELEVLANAGIEIGKSRQYLQQKMEQISQQQPQPPQMQPQPEPIKQPEQIKQPATQEFSFGSQQGVQEAQEEEQFETSKFTGIPSAPTQMQEAITELSDEEGMTEAPKASTTIKTATTPVPEAKAAAPKKPVKLSKAQQKKLAQKLKAEAKAAKAKKQSQKPAPPAAAKPTQKETAIGAREAEGRMDQELFTEMGGYSEVDEIKSIVDVGLQHGDSIEQIRESLLVSGYSKQNIEKALSTVKK